MRGDQLARPWGIIRVIEASPNGLAVEAIALQQETGIRRIYRDQEAPQVPGASSHVQRVQRANRWAFKDTFKFRIPPFLLRRAANFPKKKRFIFTYPESIHSIARPYFTDRRGSLRPWRLGVRGLDDFMRQRRSPDFPTAHRNPLRAGRTEGKEMVRKDFSRNLAQYSKPAVSINLMKEMRTA